MAISRNTPRARALRRRQTDAERRLWYVLRNRGLGGWKWKRQAPIGPFIADFYCAETGVIVELDGGQHAVRQRQDAARTAWLEAQGLRVVRFWNLAVDEEMSGVCEAILKACGGERGGASALPSPPGEDGG